MDPLDFLNDEQLLQFLHCKKTEMSIMEPHHIFLNQLRDHDLLPEDMYRKVIRRKSMHLRQKGVYDLLDWVERERPEDIKRFWRCVFEDHLLLQYHTLRQLRNNLMDGSFPEKSNEASKEETKKMKKTLEEGNTEKKPKRFCKKKKKTGTESSEEEQAGPSSMQTPRKRKKVQKPTFDSLTTRKNRNIWTKGPYKTQLTVVCGDEMGILSKEKLVRGEKCILVKDKLYTPADFEALGGKKSCKNWKQSIRCMGKTLGKLIQEGHLKCSRFIRNRNNSPQCPSHQSESSITVSDSESEEDEEKERSEEEEEEESDEEEEEEESDKEEEKEESDEEEEEEIDEEEEESDDEDENDKKEDGGEAQVFKVTCGAINGTLHKFRFATETCGKSIRTEDSWMTPMEFLRKGSASSDNWRGEIQCEGRPLSSLIEEGFLTLHDLCVCRLCSSDPEDLEDQCNDDVCFICRSQGHLVMCEKCPRSYHQKCHLPSVDDTLLEDDCEWVCTVCVYQASKGWYLPNQNVLQKVQTCPVSQHLLQCQYLLMYMYNADEERIFATDPCLQVQDYTLVIKTPMWLDKVKERLQQDHYQTVQQFMNDIQLIFENCASFNKNTAEFREMGVKLQGLFEGEFKKVFRVQQ